jgi:hypothetical protein
VQPLGENMALDQRVQRTQRRGAGAHPGGERRLAQGDRLAGIALFRFNGWRWPSFANRIIASRLERGTPRGVTLE